MITLEEEGNFAILPEDLTYIIKKSMFMRIVFDIIEVNIFMIIIFIMKRRNILLIVALLKYPEDYHNFVREFKYLIQILIFKFGKI